MTQKSDTMLKGCLSLDILERKLILESAIIHEGNGEKMSGALGITKKTLAYKIMVSQDLGEIIFSDNYKKLAEAELAKLAGEYPLIFATGEEFDSLFRPAT